MKTRSLVTATMLIGIIAFFFTATSACRRGPDTYLEPDGGHRVGSYQPFGVPTAGATPAGATGEVQLNGGSGAFAAATNVSGGSGFLAFGSGTKPSSGYLRVPYNGGSSIPVIEAKDSTAADRTFLQYGSADAWTLGNSSQDTHVTGSGVFEQTAGEIRNYAGAGFYVQDNGSSAIRFAAGTSVVTAGLPIIGEFGSNSPWSGNNGDNWLAPIAMTSGITRTLTAGEYRFTLLRFTGNISSNTFVEYPVPASDAQGYFKIIKNATTDTGLGVGTLTHHMLSLDGSAGVVVGNGKTAILWFGNIGTLRITADQ